jgi:FKBP-type peptidyl-prolyl cis-trans isomerase 2
MNMSVKKGDKVKVEYEGKFEDGTVFDSSEKQGRPLEFEVGAGHVIKGFEDAVVGMKEGDEKEFKLQPEEAYGEPNPRLVKELPRDKLPGDKLEVGVTLTVTLPNGRQIPATITKMTNEYVYLDMNHPLAGKVLTFKIKVVGVAS